MENQASPGPEPPPRQAECTPNSKSARKMKMTKIAMKTHGAGPKHGGFFPGDAYAVDLHAQTPPPLFLFLLCHAWPGHIGTEAVTKRD